MIKKYLDKLLFLFNFKIIRYSTYKVLTEALPLIRLFKILPFLDSRFISKVIHYYPNSKSQFLQDLIALSLLEFKKNGYFVEFGATDGVKFSNTYLLEKSFSYSGILSEPAKMYHAALKTNRDAIIDTRCVWSESDGEVQFSESSVGELSKVSELPSPSFLRREFVSTYQVATVSLYDLLIQHKAPTVIDFLSIDTEGAEYLILKPFPFDKYKIKVIVCEHNYTSLRDDIYQLLTKAGYVRTLKEISGVDDYYLFRGL
jgi:FkbM family methyltransferase